MKDKTLCDYFFDNQCTYDLDNVDLCRGVCINFKNEFNLTGEE